MFTKCIYIDENIKRKKKNIRKLDYSHDTQPPISRLSLKDLTSNPKVVAFPKKF